MSFNLENTEFYAGETQQREGVILAQSMPSVF